MLLIASVTYIYISISGIEMFLIYARSIIFRESIFSVCVMILKFMYIKKISRFFRI